MTGCAPSHDAVATFVAALEDIDGVTRVGLDNSTIAAESAAPAAGEAGECIGPDQKATFGLKAVFDGFAAAVGSSTARGRRRGHCPAHGRRWHELGRGAGR